VSDPILDPAELEAIQAAIRDSGGRRRQPSGETSDATRLTLVAGDRLAERATPGMLHLATRWAARADRVLAPHIGGQWRLELVGCDVVEGSVLRDVVATAWLAALVVEGAPTEGAAMLLMVQGDVIEASAARRCGDVPSAGAPDRSAATTSPAARRLFEPTGRAVVASWMSTWCEVNDRSLRVAENIAGSLADLLVAATLVRLTLKFSGDITGQIQIVAPPGMLVHPALALAAHRADAAAITRALAGVPVEIVVELGAFELPLRQLRTLSPGVTFTLPTFLDSSVPLRCGGVHKAWARPVVSRGVLAVEIERVLQGTHP